jgi:CubicO group peptidase (beta-lactamase class C family)
MRVLVYLLFILLGQACARADRIDDYMAKAMADHRIPGACVLVLQTNSTVKSSCYGLANLELNVPATAETVFEIGSLTKQFTAACVLLLAQDGKLSIEDKISKHLQNVPESWREIRIRHLLTHTSGIKSYTGLDGFELRRHLNQDQFIRALASHPLEFAPGQSFKYCNTGYNLLCFIV